MNNLAKNDQPHSPCGVEYISLVFRFQELLARGGLKVRAFSESGPERFLRFSMAEQETFTSQLRDYFNICSGAELEGIDYVKDTSAMIRFTARKMKFDVPKDFLDTLTGEEIVEIYSYEGMQIYRNMRFFEISDYTLDDFFGRHWSELYERAQSVTDKLLARIEQATKMKTCVPFLIDEHYMREMASANRKIVKVDLRYVAPLLRGDNPVAWIGSSCAEVIAARTDADAEKLVFLRPGNS